MTNETQNTDIEDVVENIIKDFDEEYPSARSYTGGRLEEYIGEKIRQALTTHGQKMYEKAKEDIAKEMIEFTQKQVELYGGKLPFVFFGEDISEQLKINIYKQGLEDFARTLQARNK